MDHAGWLVLAVVTAYGLAAAVPPVVGRLRGGAGSWAGGCLAAAVFACPALVPSAGVGLRAASAFVSGDLTFKVLEFLRHRRGPGRGMAPGAYYRFLAPFPVLAVVYPGQRRRRPRPRDPGPDLKRVAAGAAGAAAALLALRAASGVAAVRSSFALNHAAVVVTFVLAVESLSRALCGLERLAGYDTTPIIRDAYRARTVAEFWRRYNGRVHGWLYRHAFLAAGGRRAPARGVLLAFLVSGVFHEAAFALATSRLTGYQFAFFALQAPAALASGRLERLARRGGAAGRAAAHGVTVLFVAATSVLFFDGMGRIFPVLSACRLPPR